MTDDLQALIDDVLTPETDSTIAGLEQSLRETIDLLRQTHLQTLQAGQALLGLLDMNIDVLCRVAEQAGFSCDAKALCEAALVVIEAPKGFPVFTISPEQISLRKH